jgi:hypothetical protein
MADNAEGTPIYLPTGIGSFDHLLPRKAGNDSSVPGGVACLGPNGYFGVILGSAGAGKSILAMQLCARHLIQRIKGRKERKEPRKPDWLPSAASRLGIRIIV